MFYFKKIRFRFRIGLTKMMVQLTKCTLTESTISRESHLSSDDVMHASMYHKHPKRVAGPSELRVHWDQLPPQILAGVK